MFKDISVEDMIGDLHDHLGEDDFTEPLEILISSARRHNKFSRNGKCRSLRS